MTGLVAYSGGKFFTKAAVDFFLSTDGRGAWPDSKELGIGVSISFPAERKFRLVKGFSTSKERNFIMKGSANRRDVEFVNL